MRRSTAELTYKVRTCNSGWTRDAAFVNVKTAATDSAVDGPHRMDGLLADRKLRSDDESYFRKLRSEDGSYGRSKLLRRGR